MRRIRKAAEFVAVGFFLAVGLAIVAGDLWVRRMRGRWGR